MSDLDNHRVQVFTRDGDFIRQFGLFGVEPGQFQVTFDLSADAEGNAYVIDDGLQRLTKFSPTGVPIWTADGETDPRLGGFEHTAAIDPEGRIVMVIGGADTVVYVSPDGEFVDLLRRGRLQQHGRSGWQRVCIAVSRGGDGHRLRSAAPGDRRGSRALDPIASVRTGETKSSPWATTDPSSS